VSRPADPSRGWIYVERALFEDDVDEIERLHEGSLAEAMRMRGREPETVSSAVTWIARARAVHASEVRAGRRGAPMQGRRRLLALLVALVVVVLAFVVVLRAVPR
jgi:hypothetical protein